MTTDDTKEQAVDKNDQRTISVSQAAQLARYPKVAELPNPSTVEAVQRLFPDLTDSDAELVLRTAGKL
jgi:hypothetical protein